MTKVTNPFAGIKLSDQTNPSHRKLDQQLFVPSPQKQPTPATSSPEPQLSGTPKSRESGSPGIRESGKPDIRDSGMSELRKPGSPGIQESGVVRTPQTPSLSTIKETPLIKETFLITDGEYEDMEDMKLQLRRLLDMKASKQDIIRCAVQYILEDFRKHPETSIIVGRLQQKKNK
jgi:hypothetical protein